MRRTKPRQGEEGGILRYRKWDFRGIVGKRYSLRTTIVMSQLARDVWYQALGDPTPGDAILDRLLRCANTTPSGRIPAAENHLLRWRTEMIGLVRGTAIFDGDPIKLNDGTAES
jgi:hypothetical protein